MTGSELSDHDFNLRATLIKSVSESFSQSVIKGKGDL